MLYYNNNNLIKFLILFALSFSVSAMTDKEIEELFNQAIEESESGDLGKAIALYENILSNRPELSRVRLELALANFRALNYATAKGIAEETLADPEIPENVKITVREFLEEVNAQSKPHSFSGFVSAGLLYDDNPNSGVANSIIDLGGGNVLTLTNATPDESVGLRVFGGVSHRYLFPETFKLADTPVATSWQSTASIYRDQYLEDGSGEITLSVLTARTGPTFLASRKWAARLPVEYNYIHYATDALAWYLSVNPGVSLFLGSTTVLSIDAEVEKREYFAATNNDRDSDYYSVEFNLGHQFTEINARPSLNVGAKVFKENARTARRSNDGWEVSAGASFNPYENVTGYANYSLESSKYDGVEPVFGNARDEMLTSWSLGVNYAFTDQGLLNNSVANLSVNKTSNNSNVPTFAYERNQVVFNLSKSFE